MALLTPAKTSRVDRSCASRYVYSHLGLLPSRLPQLARRPFAFSIIAMIVCGVCEASPASCASANQEQAAAAVAQAQTAVSHAAEAGALWLNAREALDKALRAQAQRDHRTACREAISAADFARMGIEQLGYPLYRH